MKCNNNKNLVIAAVLVSIAVIAGGMFAISIVPSKESGYARYQGGGQYYYLLERVSNSDSLFPLVGYHEVVTVQYPLGTIHNELKEWMIEARYNSNIYDYLKIRLGDNGSVKYDFRLNEFVYSYHYQGSSHSLEINDANLLPSLKDAPDSEYEIEMAKIIIADLIKRPRIKREEKHGILLNYSSSSGDKDQYILYLDELTSTVLRAVKSADDSMAF